jgi:hypothetical protein
MATTTNYGWTTPDDTALVKDGASAIRSLGTSVDTTTKNLNPSTTLGDIEYRSSTANTNTRVGIGTSGQALTVVAGVPSWAASATSVLTTTGDTLYASAANTLTRRAIGSTGDVLTVAGGVPTWAAPAAGGMTLLQSLALSGASTTSSTFTPASYKSYYIVLSGIYVDNPNSAFQIRLNADTGSNYYRSTMSMNDTTFAGSRSSGGNLFLLATIGALSANGEKTSGFITIDRINDTTEVPIQSTVYTTLSSNADVRMNISAGTYNNSAAISSITFIAATQNFAAGTAYIYGVN